MALSLYVEPRAFFAIAFRLGYVFLHIEVCLAADKSLHGPVYGRRRPGLPGTRVQTLYIYTRTLKKVYNFT